MNLRRPPVDEGPLLLLLGALELYHQLAGIQHYVVERPADGELPEVIRILDSDDEEVGEAEVGNVGVGQVVRPQFEEEEDRLSESDEEDDDETDNSSDWSSSEDSGYESMFSDEEDIEDSDEEDQQLPPEDYPPVRPPSPVAAPQQPTLRRPQDEEPAPSTSGLDSSVKRSREDSDTEQVSMKRQRQDGEDSPEDPAPSTSGLGSSAARSTEESYRDSAPSTSGLQPPGYRRYWIRPLSDDDSDSD